MELLQSSGTTRKRKREGQNEKSQAQPESVNGERHKGPRRRRSVVNGTIAKQQKAQGKEGDLSAVIGRKMPAASLRNAWRLSDPIGGAFINADPVFAADETHMFLAHRTAVKVLSIADSTVVRSLELSSTSKRSRITGFALSRTEPSCLYFSTAQGLVYYWDWKKGTKLGRWDLKSPILGLAVGVQDGPDRPVDIVFTLDAIQESVTRISAHKLVGGAEASKTESKTILQVEKQISGFKLGLDGQVLIVSSGPLLIVGYSLQGPKTPFRDSKYEWRELRTPDRITCMDVRQSSNVPRANGTKSKPKASIFTEASIDVVVGNEQGVVFAHQNILNKLMILEQRGAAALEGSLVPRKLHWHREEVHSVRWSRDGEYVISGGNETVLLLWQLETGKQQYLPHLSASIESIEVSPSGAAYAVRLSDNSCMVISTAELTPTANFAGIQALRLQRPMSSKVSNMKRIGSDGKSQGSLSPFRMTSPQIVISALAPHQILVAVPGSQDAAQIHNSYVGCPYLQTFDHVANRHISRQALTRNNATNKNIGPEANKIDEPVVRWLSISADGRWLASVDEWVPPRKDVAHFMSGIQDEQRAQESYRQVYLKFWRLKPDQTEWELVSRIDGASSYGRVVDLIADPVSDGFVTVSDDGSTRIWNPQHEMRGAVVIQRGAKGDKTEPLWTWKCRHVIMRSGAGPIPKYVIHESRGSTDGLSARAAYSSDGSVLAIAHEATSVDQLGTVDFVDAARGKVHLSRVGLFSGSVHALGFVKQYLVIMSHQLIVWDTVQDRVEYSFALRLSELSLSLTRPTTHLATDSANGTFAVSLPIGKGTNASRGGNLYSPPPSSHSQLLVFDPSSPVPLYCVSTHHAVTALAHIPGSREYVALDTEAQLRKILPREHLIRRSVNEAIPSSSVNDETGMGNGVEAARKGVRDILLTGITTNDASSADEEDEAVTPSRILSSTLLLQAAADDAERNEIAVVRPQQLAEIFDVGPVYSMPRLEDLYEQVAALFAQKTLTD